MANCIRERGSACTGIATRVIEALEGGWSSEKCDPCVQWVRMRTGSSFDELYRVRDRDVTEGFLKSRSLCFQ